MKRAIKIGAALAVAAVLLACANIPITKADRAWAEMCELADQMYGYSCDGIDRPKVKYESMEEGLWGYYDGSDTVFINRDLKGREQMQTLIHEMVHYLHLRLGLLELPTTDALAVCTSEAEAWALEGVWSGDDNSNWWFAYPHCWEFYVDETDRKSSEAFLDFIEGWLEGIFEGIR